MGLLKKDSNGYLTGFLNTAGTEPAQAKLTSSGAVPVDATFSGDIQIGAVELKNGTTDDRGIVAVASSADATKLALYTAALSYQPTAANNQSEVYQGTAANLNATVTGTVDIGTAPHDDLTIADFVSVANATAADLNATVTGMVDIGAMPPVNANVTGIVAINSMPNVTIATLPDINLATGSIVSIDTLPDVNVATLPDVNIATLPDVRVLNTTAADLNATVTGAVDISSFPTGSAMVVSSATASDLNATVTGAVDISSFPTGSAMIVSNATASDLNATVTGSITVGTMPDVTVGTLPDVTVGTMPSLTVGTMPSLTVGTLPDITPNRIVNVTSATGSGAINTSTAITKKFRLSSVTLHADAAMDADDDLKITLDANDGANYDALLYEVNLDGATDVCFTPTNDLIFEAGDEIVVASTNTNTVTYGLRIVCEEI
jgi:hypothetical protein